MKLPILAAILAVAACGPNTRGATGDGGPVGDGGGGGVDAAPQTVSGSRLEGNAPANSAQMFSGATETSSLAPAIVYPADGIVAPPNLGEFDVHWTTSADNLFAVHFGNQYADYTVYTTGQPGASWWTVLTPAEWAQLATTLHPLQVTVAGMNTAAPTTKGTSTPITVSAAARPIVGGVYYWSTSTGGANEGDMFHYDTSTPSVPAAPYYTAAAVPGGCIGCHALSHDGTKLAFTTVTVPGPGEIVHTADQTALVTGTTNWDFATFNADGTKLVTADDKGSSGALTLRSASTGASLASIPASAGTFGDHPDLSPDGTLLANVETSNNNFNELPVIMPDNGAVVVRTFDDASNSFGAIKTVIADGVGGLSSFYPSFSPDGQWLLVTRVDASQNANNDADGAVGVYANPASKTWVVKADGSQPPIELANANSTGALGDSWARWAPFSEADTTGAQLYFITFTSVRKFGVRIPQVGSPQIWMAPFYPAKATAGDDPSGPAFRVPFQDVTNHNHIAQWSQQVVVIQ